MIPGMDDDALLEHLKHIFSSVELDKLIEEYARDFRMPFIHRVDWGNHNPSTFANDYGHAEETLISSLQGDGVYTPPPGTIVIDAKFKEEEEHG